MPYGQVLVDTVKDSLNNVLAPASAVFRNRLFDAGFIINQRGYVSGTALSASAYAHDRWKAGASGCTYTFTQLSTGVPIVITITAGSLQQVIEGCNMPEGGTYTLSWTGTAQARFNGGTYGSSPLAVTGITAGSNTTIEFNTGTVSYPQLEVGTNATSFDYRPYGTELALCQRYLPAILGANNPYYINYSSSTGGNIYVNYPVTPRTAPTGLTYASLSHYNMYGSLGANNPTTISFQVAGTSSISINVSGAGAIAASGQIGAFLGNGTGSSAAQILLTGCEL